jgi:hypothetical protein
MQTAERRKYMKPFTQAVLLIVAALAIPAGTLAQVQVLFQDNFAGGANPLWDNYIGNWQTFVHPANAADPIAGATGYGATVPNNDEATYSGLPWDFDNYTMDVDISALGDGGVWLRMGYTLDNKGNPIPDGQGILLICGGNGFGSSGRVLNDPRCGTSLYYAFVGFGNDPAWNALVPNQQEQGGIFVPTVGPNCPPGAVAVGGGFIEDPYHLHIVAQNDLYDVTVTQIGNPNFFFFTQFSTSPLVNPNCPAGGDMMSGLVGLYDYSGLTPNPAISPPVVDQGPDQGGPNAVAYDQEFENVEIDGQTVATVPEPSSLTLLAGGTFALLSIGARKRLVSKFTLPSD